ncbi:MAG: ATP-dependent DNA helicase RecG [Pirellulaceae bacterium]
MSLPADEVRRLAQPLALVPGVGSSSAGLLERIGLRRAVDLLFHFPRRYEDFTETQEIKDLNVGHLTQVIGTVKEVEAHVSEAGRHVLYLLVEQDRQYLRAVFFNQPFLENRFRAGQKIMLRGTVSERGARLQMVQPKTQVLDPNQPLPTGKLLPVYGLTEGLKQRQMRQLVEANLNYVIDEIQEAFPEELRHRLGLLDIHSAIRQIHFPDSHEQAAQAHRRLAFQELFVLQIALAMRRHQLAETCSAPRIELTPLIRDRIMGRFPFELTDSQLAAFEQIAADMNREVPMNRLLQGDVGSGKTAVAVGALLLCVACGFQAVFMAPTEILARQHERTLLKWLKASRVRIELWTGSVGHKSQLAERIASGGVDIVVGTQAIVSGRLKFQNLGLAVVDEQHKFGVKQRAMLKALSDRDPHYLVMTATPIPRTISMTVFGDLDVSTIIQPPDMRAVVHTYIGSSDQREKWWEFVAKKLREGRQAYVIAPLVDGDDNLEISSAERLFESLVNGPLEAFRVDLLHGRQSAEEKDAALTAFAMGKTQVIVATSVVEVGIDVPNATVMTIESAERFGLSQLHQLRGRIGRGQHPGFVCAFSTSDDQVDNERLKAFAETNEGFKLAEIDMRLRGPGNLFSTEQTGFPPLRIASLVDDVDLLELSRNEAAPFIADDPELARPEHARLRELVATRYGATLDISDVG